MSAIVIVSCWWPKGDLVVKDVEATVKPSFLIHREKGT